VKEFITAPNVKDASMQWTTIAIGLTIVLDITIEKH